MKIHNSIPVLLGTILLVVTAASVSCQWSSSNNGNYGKDMSELDEEFQEDTGPSINYGSGPVSNSPAALLGISKFTNTIIQWAMIIINNINRHYAYS